MRCALYQIRSTAPIQKRTELRLILMLSLVLTGCRKSHPENSSLAISGNADEQTTNIEPEVRAFCGGCHAVPRPESFPKAAWYDEVRRGYDFYFKSGRRDLKPPVQSRVVTWFRDRAPERLPLIPPLESPSPVKFTTHELHIDSGAGESRKDQAPAVASVVWVPQAGSESGNLWLCDMRRGQVLSMPGLTSRASPADIRHLSVCSHPAVARTCDLNGNGKPDLLVCDLGSFLPEDHERGQLLWLSDGVTESESVPIPLLKEIGRIADCRVADFDGDGDSDVVVAEFGWHTTGGIHLLWNEGLSSDGHALQVRSEKIDTRPGTIHVPVVDLNGDGRQDFVALISQEHESIIAFLNRPDGFQKQVIYAAPDPSWGSSGIELTDLDQDGDLDVIYTNGDSFDSYLLKPYHGVRWLENCDGGLFQEHLLASVPGVHRAIPADLDGDGDLDLAVAALIPEETRQSTTVPHEGVLWLEQSSPGEFERHRVAESRSRHAALEVGDFDFDGDVDMVAGGFYGPHDDHLPTVILFRNDGR